MFKTEIQELRLKEAKRVSRSIVGGLASLGKTKDLEYKLISLKTEANSLARLLGKIADDFVEGIK